MPWSPSESKSKTRKANTPAKQRKWSQIANSILEKTGSDSSAIRIASAAIKRGRGGKKK